jgi:cyclohexa-1,5-dienecarbonyl-CoA hydratase
MVGRTAQSYIATVQTNGNRIMTMEKTKLEYSHQGSVAKIILDDGKGNILDQIMLEEIQQHVSMISSQSGIKMIVFEGAGKHFSFGASVEEHQKEFAAAMLYTFHKTLFSILDLNIPTMARITGQCLGGGLELALICNFMFADKSVRMGQPEIVLGVFPPPASLILPLKIGEARAEELLITGRTISAEEALKYGLLLDVYEDKITLQEQTDNWISEHIIPKSAISLKYAVRASRVKFTQILRNFLPQLESMYVNQLMATHDANEGITSFLEKRKPVWENG